MTRRTKKINIPSHYSGKGRPQMISLFACRGVLEPCWQTATLRLSGSCWRHLTLWNWRMSVGISWKTWVKPHSTRLVDFGGWCTWTFAKLGAWYGNRSRNLVMGNPTFEKHWTDMKLHGTINQLKGMKLAIWTSQKCYHWKVRPKVQVLFFHSCPGRTSSPGAKQRERQTEAEQKIRSWIFYMLSKAE